MINSFSGEYRFLSNFYPEDRGDLASLEIHFEGITYRTVEHAYQAAKTTHEPMRLWIARSKSPGEAKRLGRTITIRDDWDNIKLEIMDQLLRQKFSRFNPELRRLLINTDPHTLVEGNHWHDNFWGECYCSRCQSLFKGEAYNHLGKLLMKLRVDSARDVVDECRGVFWR